MQFAIPSKFFILSGLLVLCEGRIQCLDDDNNPVDWFVAYKLPQLKESAHPFIHKGLGYMIITSNHIDNGWTVSSKSINSSSSFIGQTLKDLYDTKTENDLLWLLYNDETPNKTVRFDLGHTKGVVLAKADGGVWLVHSVPRYPPIPGIPGSIYSYPFSGTYFGQSFLCLSLTIDQLDRVGQQLLYNEPQVYSSNIPSALEKSVSHLAAVTKHTTVTTAPWYHQLELSTLGGVSFISFAKTKKFGKDLYADWVAPSLKTDLLVETWPNGKGRLPSECILPYKVNNIEDIKLKSSDISFKTHVDHSKWGISSGNTSFWVCVGDINRMKTQATRGGGTVCVNNCKLWTQYRDTVAAIEPCSKPPQKFPKYLPESSDVSVWELIGAQFGSMAKWLSYWTSVHAVPDGVPGWARDFNQ